MNQGKGILAYTEWEEFARGATKTCIGEYWRRLTEMRRDAATGESFAAWISRLDQVMSHLEGMGEKITENLKASKLLCIGNEDERVFAISKVKDETYKQLRDRLKDMSYLDSRHTVTATSRGSTGGQLAMTASSSANSSKGNTTK